MKTNAWVWRVSLLLSSFLVMLNAEPANTAFAQSNQKPYGESVARLLSGVDEELVKEFKNAWVSSHAGASELESVVLIFKMRDGRYLGKLQRNSYEFKKASFRWPSNAVAIVHTHPRRCEPRPSTGDRRLAEELNVPVFTITARGMYVYDPATRKTTMARNRLDWLDPSKWKAGSLPNQVSAKIRIYHHSLVDLATPGDFTESLDTAFRARFSLSNKGKIARTSPLLPVQ